jgi:DNA repair exonuclease SbcCD ATPase subunit
MNYPAMKGKLNQALLLRKMNLTKLSEMVEKEKLLIDEKATITDAQVFCQNVAKETQDALKIHIEDLVNLFLGALFGDMYEFRLNYVPERGKTTAHLDLYEDGQEVEVLDGVGGGVSDVLSTALRISLLLISNGNKVLVLDEIGKHISQNLRPAFYEILQRISRDFNIQVIMVTHDEQCIAMADKVFTVTKNEGVSSVGS